MAKTQVNGKSQSQVKSLKSVTTKTTVITKTVTKIVGKKQSSAVKPIVKSVEKTVRKVAGKPTVNTAKKLAVKPAGKAAGKTAKKPAGKPVVGKRHEIDKINSQIDSSLNDIRKISNTEIMEFNHIHAKLEKQVKLEKRTNKIKKENTKSIKQSNEFDSVLHSFNRL